MQKEYENTNQSVTKTYQIVGKNELKTEAAKISQFKCSVNKILKIVYIIIKDHK